MGRRVGRGHMDGRSEGIVGREGRRRGMGRVGGEIY